MTNLTYEFPDTAEATWLAFIRAVNKAAVEAGEEKVFEEARLIGETWLGSTEPDPFAELEEGETGREIYPEARLSILRTEGGEATVAISARTERTERLFRAARAGEKGA